MSGGIKNHKYILTVEHTEHIINSFVSNKFPCCDFVVRKSDMSNSIYIDIFYCETKHTIRVSDHKAVNKIKSTIVKNSTKNSLVANTIVNSVKQLKRYVFNKKMYEISKEK